MADEWRARFSEFLRVKGRVPEPQVRHYVAWVDRLLSRAPAEGDPTTPLIVRRFLAEVGRHGAAWQVVQAADAVRLYGSFRAEPDAWEVLIGEMTRVLRLKHLSLRTEKSYLGWVRRFRSFTGVEPGALDPVHVERFLSHLAVEGRVSPSTQNQAFSALLFLYRNVLRIDVGDLGATVRARGRRRVPVVLTRDEVRAVLAHLEEPYGLMCRMIYGCGQRLQECLELRVKDVDFERGLLTVRGGKGDSGERSAPVVR